jgi:hypothetical protein
MNIFRTRNTTESIVVRHRLEDEGSILDRDKIFFSLLHSIKIDSAAQPASYPLVPVAVSPEIKRPERGTIAETETP